MAQSFDLKEKLLELDLHVDDIGYLIISHLHFDHAGNLWMFRRTKAGAGVIVQKEEARHAFLCANRYDCAEVTYHGDGYVRHEFNGLDGVAFKLVRGDVKLADDLELVLLSGHTPGTMGLGVATHFAMHGHPIHLFSRAEETLQKARKQVAENLRSMKELGVISEETAKSAGALMSYYTDMKAAVSDADLVIENVLENEDVKKSTFAQLDQYCRADAILADNTSSLNIYEFLEVSHRERLVITHFLVPAYVMPLVEIVRGPETSDETVGAVKELMSSTGKNPAVVNKVVPGFIMNRLTFAIFREAAYMVS